MYVDSSPVTTRRSGELRSACRQATRHTGISAKAGRRPPAGATAAARRTRVTDAVVSQWLLDQLPAEHRLRR